MVNERGQAMKCARFVNGRCEQCGMLRAFYGECAGPQPANPQSPAQMTRDQLREFIRDEVGMMLRDGFSADTIEADRDMWKKAAQTASEDADNAEARFRQVRLENESLRSTMQAKRHEAEMWRKSFQSYVAATGKAESIAAAYESARVFDGSNGHPWGMP